MAVLAIMLTAAACGGSSQATQTTTPRTGAAQSVIPRATWAPDDSFVSLAGTVVQTDDDAFTLDYGDGQITVEMDDWDWIPEGRDLLVNDEVIVYGRVDDDFYERRTIEAGSVYVKDAGTLFFASSDDEEDFRNVTVIEFSAPKIELTGTVKRVEGEHFVLQSGSSVLEVDTSEMAYNPLDDQGLQRVRAGDRVRVRGKLDERLFNDRDLIADSVMSIRSPRSDSSANGSNTSGSNS